MEKEQNLKNENSKPEEINEKDVDTKTTSDLSDKSNKEEEKEKNPEEKILELEDKLTRTFAEMENQKKKV